MMLPSSAARPPQAPRLRRLRRMRRAPNLFHGAVRMRTHRAPALTALRLRTVLAALARGWAGPAVASGVPFPSPLFLRRNSNSFAAKMPRIMIKGGVWRNTEVRIGSLQFLPPSPSRSGWGPGGCVWWGVGGAAGRQQCACVGGWMAVRMRRRPRRLGAVLAALGRSLPLTHTWPSPAPCRCHGEQSLALPLRSL